eukprot:1385428-Amorphochlora_amoeboformis.AAC.1
MQAAREMGSRAMNNLLCPNLPCVSSYWYSPTILNLSHSSVELEEGLLSSPLASVTPWIGLSDSVTLQKHFANVTACTYLNNHIWISGLRYNY